MTARLGIGTWIVAGVKLVVQGAGAPHYGYFGDELYYLACADHLAWGYVDHPPLSIALLAGWTGLFGDGLVAVRALSVALGVGAVLLSGQLARALGGGTRAQTLAAIAAAAAPVNLVLNNYYSMNAVDVVVWLLAFVALTRILEQPTRSRWIAFGLLLGLGLLNKISVLWLGLGLAVGLVATPYRALLRTPGPWLACAVAAALFAPHIVWQIWTGWPTLEFVHVATTQKMEPVGPVSLFTTQILVLHPLSFPIWAAGLGWLWTRREGPGRLFAIVFAVTAAILIVNGTSRPNYLSLAQPPLLAGGAIAIERFSQHQRWRWLLPTLASLLALTGLAASPATVPLLPLPDAAEFFRGLPVDAPKQERRAVGALPPHFADMQGWPELVATVARAWQGLSDADRSRAAILAHNYSDAGAIDLLGPSLGLPRAIATHNSYWLWGPGEASGAVMLVLAGEREALESAFESVERVGRLECPDCLPHRQSRPLWLTRGARRPLAELWAEWRHYD